MQKDNNLNNKQIENPWHPKTILDRVLNISEGRSRYIAKITPIDRFLEKTFLPLIPSYITPNQITIFRFISIPVLVILFLFHFNLLATIIFIFSAFSDALDGALARTKNKITTWGIVYDPLADKLLIGTVAIIVISKYLSPALAGAMVAIELFLIISAYFRFTGKVIPAKTIGKLKMVFQSFGIIFLLLFVNIGFEPFYILASYTLYGALILALMSLFVYRSI